MTKTYDFVIIGGGSAGSVLGDRLSADGTRNVLVLEAGRSDFSWDLLIQMPAALPFPAGKSLYDWKYESDPEPHMNGRRVKHARGKVLGGSSSINGMIYQRGNPLDYERWGADPGMEKWGFAHCLPYFKRLENALAADPEDDYRGHDGPLKLERGPAKNPLFQAFFDAAVEAGYSRTPDVNGFRQEGFGPFDKHVYKGRRLSASRAYLHPAMKRQNLTVQTRAFVASIDFDGNRAKGVTYQRNGKTHQVNAGEVILAGGAINTPQLLQLSGVGDAEHLRSLGINPVVDLPGVGENLQDHLEAYIQYSCPKPVSEQPNLNKLRMPWIGLQWLLGRKGPAATNHFEGGGFVRSNEDVKYPNLMFHFLPVAVRYDGQKADTAHGFQVHVGPMYSDARGSLKIRSKNPKEHPSMVYNYLSTEQDRREWIEAVRISREIMSQPAMAPYNSGEISPGSSVKTDEEILDWVAKDAETALHPSCTAKMGPASDPMAVVDPDTMKVHGLENVRVADASAMPYVTNGNIHAPVLMLAEKAADLILGREPLAPIHADFYRHGVHSADAGTIKG
ncbi:choline dehydrogenase [Salipaludibacillus agaradhaerens]|uniref:Choline dehydrogenase n=1 Tax=Salipaludibacillus agaradhaerens TaxID=76935 RepID=A0A9Q4G0C5_SALAG|nr:choline dehydrogenase [Salipaludibacillus agaradhaerens]MCR6097743.1 choline dehydrogenase [Salipaludibacillus agaradhaerens]MCR6112773.1 choline dehydrogenase [Salipaludibacillus agaradhaerens]